LFFLAGCPGRVLVGPDDGGVDEDPAELPQVRVGRRGREQAGEVAGRDPPAEPVVHGVPRSELGGQVPPRDAGAGQVQEGLEELAVGQDRRLAAAVLAGRCDERLQGRPEVVREHVPHGIRSRNRVISAATCCAKTVTNVNTP
jgi:hypothetical protein